MTCRTPNCGTRNKGGHVMVLAHRLVWELTYGPIPATMCVLHQCDNPACIEPSHLFLGTQQDNIADMVAKGRKVVKRAGPPNCHPEREHAGLGLCQKCYSHQHYLKTSPQVKTRRTQQRDQDHQGISS